MILDTSALIAVLRKEPEATRFADLMEAADSRRLSAVNYLEAAIVVDGRRNPIDSRRFDEFVREGSIVIEPVTKVHARVARDAYRDFGKGSGHPAQLNLGDCFAYALAKVSGEPLLFKGSDFSHTDIAPAQ